MRSLLVIPLRSPNPSRQLLALLLFIIGATALTAGSNSEFLEACETLLRSHTQVERHRSRPALEPHIKHAPSFLPSLILGNRNDTKPVPDQREFALRVYERAGTIAAPTSEHLLPGLSHPSPVVRQASARALGRIGYPAGHAAPRLIALGRDPDPDVATTALEAFHHLGPCIRTILPQFTALFSDPTVAENIRELALEILRELKREAAPCVPQVRILLRNREEPLRRHALDLIVEIGPAAAAAVPECQAIIQENPPQPLMGSAVEAIASIGPLAKPCLPILVKMLTRYPADDRSIGVIEAISAIGMEPRDHSQLLLACWQRVNNPSSSLSIQYRHALENLGAAAVPGLLAIIQDPNSIRRAAALETIQRMGTVGHAATEPLKTLLDEPSMESLRVQLAVALSAIAPSEEQAYEPTFLQILSGADLRGQIQVVAALAHTQLPEPSDRLIDALTALLEHEPHFVPQYVVSALGDLGRAARRALPKVHQALQKPNPKVRAAALHAIPQLGEPAASGIPLLYSYLDDPDDEIRDAAIRGLAHYGPKAESTVPRLTEILLDLADVDRRQAILAKTRKPQGFGGVELTFTRPNAVRTTTATAIGKIARHPDIAIPALTRAISDSHESLQESAAISLGAYRSAARDALPLLREMEINYLDRRSQAATIAISLIEPPSEKTVTLLLHLAQTTRDNVQGYAIEALGILGPIASSALPYLETISESRSPYLRPRAQKAIASIRGRSEHLTESN